MAYTSFLLEFNQYITPDGQVYNFDTSTKFVMTETGTGMPPIDYITQKGAFQHGETLLDYRLKPRIIQMLVRRNGTSRQEYWNNRADMLNFFRPNRWLPGVNSQGILRKTLPDGTHRDLNVIIQQGPEFVARNLDTWDEWAISETLRFIAYDPIYHSDVVNSVIWSPAGISNLVFPITFPITFDAIFVSETKTINYVGTWNCFPTVIVTGPGAGFRLVNNATGKVLAMNYNQAAGEVITFDLSFGKKTVKNGSGVNLVGALTADCDLTTFAIACSPEASGGVNNLNARLNAANSSSRIEVRWISSYIGI